MSDKKTDETGTSRKSYFKPAFKLLTKEAARRSLEEKAQRGDQEAAALLKLITRLEDKK